MKPDEMKISGIKYSKVVVAGGILLIGFGLLFPVFLKDIWFKTIFMIREAIITGDSGHLILASAFISFLYSIQSSVFFMGTMLVIFHTEIKNRLKPFDIFLLSLITITSLHWSGSLMFEMPWEPVSTVLALTISLFLSERLLGETSSFIQVFIVSVQVFFAFYWLNIMPCFSSYQFGKSDIPYSIKIAGLYLNADTVLNFSGFSFFLPFIISAFVTATLFISYSQNIRMMRENYKKETEIGNMRTNALESRVYQEVHSLVHDLKTPLVTIRGLNSLLISSKGREKLEEYSNRIENSVTKMNEMISGFLYESSRQKISAMELFNFIRAQLPLEDEKIRFNIGIEDGLPDIYVNKVRIARAIINIFENAIIVPHEHAFKIIEVKVQPAEKGVRLIIKDNGIGIKETELLKIWDVGYSTNNTSGMGLPFAKRVIEDNAGAIEIISRPEIGTTVTIFLPSIECFEEFMRGDQIENK